MLAILFLLPVCLVYGSRLIKILKFSLSVLLLIFYFVSPLDLIPEAFLGPVGYADDLSLLFSEVWCQYREESVRESSIMAHLAIVSFPGVSHLQKRI